MGLIVDKDSNAILTMVERSTNFLIMEKLKYDKKAMPLAKTVWRLLLPYMGEHLKTITTDNGSEFAEHEWVAHRLALDIYFTDGRKELSRTPTSLSGSILQKEQI